VSAPEAYESRLSVVMLAMQITPHNTLIDRTQLLQILLEVFFVDGTIL